MNKLTKEQVIEIFENVAGYKGLPLEDAIKDTIKQIRSHDALVDQINQAGARAGE